MMKLTDEQQRILDGEKGETMAKVMKTLIMYGEIFGAEKLVPVTSRYNHLVTSFGLKALGPVYDLMDQLIRAGAVSGQKFSVDPRPLDPNVPANFLQNLVFKKFMYSKQAFYENQLRQLGLMDEDAFSCACYLDEQGNRPAKGEVLSWAESSAVVYANSVLGARCNRNSGIMDLMGSVAGYVPYFGLLTDEGRKATWVVRVQTTRRPEAQLLGSAIGMKVMEDVPYVMGLDRWLGNELTDAACAYLKDFGAATASNGAVGLYHIDGLTPEAKEQGNALIAPGAREYIIDDAELQRVKDNYPLVWKDPGAKPKLCFVGCPHLSLQQLEDWTRRLEEGLRAAGRKKVGRPHGVHHRPRRQESVRGRPVRRPAGCHGGHPLLHLPADVHEQPAVRPDAGDHLLQQAAHLHHRPLLHRGGTPRPDHERGSPAMKEFHGRVVAPGCVTAPALVSHGGLNTLASFQKALQFGDKKATCGDQNNPDLYGKPMAGKALCLPQTIGSTTGGLVLYCACSMNRQPACLLVLQPHRLAGGRRLGAGRRLAG